VVVVLVVLVVVVPVVLVVLGGVWSGDVWCLGRTSSVLVSLPPALASLVVVSVFCSGFVVGEERAA
jgi:hypothetical protein